MENLKTFMMRGSGDEMVSAVLLHRLLTSSVPSLQSLGQEILKEFEAEIQDSIDHGFCIDSWITESGGMCIGALMAMERIESDKAETGKPRIRKVV